jgi:glycosyltransferase involved in cell wall biosynthesis
MITYNHEVNIRQSIEGILMQRANFRVELVIGEDYSKDSTREICEEYVQKYPEIIKLLPSYKNLGMAPNFLRTLEECTGKYIAICDGDDYWTDPLKLQQQVDFLEANPDYGMIHSRVNIIDSTNKLISESHSQVPSGEVFYDLLKSAFIVTCSTCFRADIAREIIIHAVTNNLKCIFDYWLWLHVAIRSKIHFSANITSTYRSHPSGVTKGRGNILQSISALAVLDAVSYKLIHFPEKKFHKKWELLVDYCRALTTSNLSWSDRNKYLRFLLHKPICLFAFFPAFWRKIQLRLSIKKAGESI